MPRISTMIRFAIFPLPTLHSDPLQRQTSDCIEVVVDLSVESLVIGTVPLGVLMLLWLLLMLL